MAGCEPSVLVMVELEVELPEAERATFYAGEVRVPVR